MQNFIVLGIVPGTNIQFNFHDWLIISLVTIIVGTVLLERHAIRAFVLTHYVAHRIKQLSITKPALEA